MHPLGTVSDDRRTITINNLSEIGNDNFANLYLLIENHVELANVEFEFEINDPKLIGQTNFTGKFRKMPVIFWTLDGIQNNSENFVGASIDFALTPETRASKNGTYYITLKYQGITEKFKLILDL